MQHILRSSEGFAFTVREGTETSSGSLRRQALVWGTKTTPVLPDYLSPLLRPLLSLTCSQEAMSGQQQLRGDLHLGLAFVFEGGKVSLVFIGRHFFPAAVVGWKKHKEEVCDVLQIKLFLAEFQKV